MAPLGESLSFVHSDDSEISWILDRFSGSSGSAFDISGLSGSAEFTNIQNDAFSDFLNKHDPSDPIDPLFASRIESKYGIKLLGQYSDTEGNNGGFSNPEVDFSSTGGGSVITTVTADAKSPSPTAVDWLEMDSSSGTLASTVLLIETVAGQPPNEDVSNSQSVAGNTQLKMDFSV